MIIIKRIVSAKWNQKPELWLSGGQLDYVAYKELEPIWFNQMHLIMVDNNMPGCNSICCVLACDFVFK